MSNSHAFEFPMGAEVKDTITGFRGVITGRAQFITGCDQYSVLPRLNTVKKSSSMPENQWIDEVRLELVEKGEHLDPTKYKKSGKQPGCDQSPPTRS